MSRSMTARERRLARRIAATDHRQALHVQRQWHSPRPVPWTELHEGVVIDVNLEYREDRRQWKRRPALVIEVSARDLLVYECTTRLRRHPRQVLLRDWRECGLSQPTGVWLHPRRIDRSHVLGVVGSLPERDFRRLRQISDLLD